MPKGGVRTRHRGLHSGLRPGAEAGLGSDHWRVSAHGLEPQCSAVKPVFAPSIRSTNGQQRVTK